VVLKKFNVNFFASYTDIINESDLIILMVKPNNYIQVITEMNPYLSKKVVIVSFMAGIESSLNKK
jgi:pyrroline-5-carboxylate reductase